MASADLAISSDVIENFRPRTRWMVLISEMKPRHVIFPRRDRELNSIFAGSFLQSRAAAESEPHGGNGTSRNSANYVGSIHGDRDMITNHAPGTQMID